MGKALDDRRDPDELLDKIKRQEKAKTKGKLKIFFGYAAGVGKTYTMLEDAHEAKEQGLDIMVGYIEPHTRPETLNLLKGLEILPSVEVMYRGIHLNEFDLDGALRRKPDLILVDELAHTNAPGSRHTKRYSDIEELLNAGIDVYTTVNVQHVESLNDIVASITQVVVQERVPDYMFDRAEQIELIDLEPEELIQRLHSGKIYKQKQAGKALENFFIEDNLVALREISLRYTADQVNQDRKTGKEAFKTHGKYTVNEHILVCIDHSAFSKKAICIAARMAHAFHGRLTALYVETFRSKWLSKDQKQMLHENIQLAEKLGAKTVSTYSDNIPAQIVEFAKISYASKIVVGSGRKSKSFFGFFLGRLSLLDQLIDLAWDFEICIVPLDDGQPFEEEPLYHKRKWFSVKDFIKMVAIMGVTALVAVTLHFYEVQEESIIIIFLLGVLITANQTNSPLYGAIASVIGVISFDYFFASPQFSFQANREHVVTFVVMLTAAMITSTLTSRAKSQAVASALNLYRTDILLEANNKLQHAETLETIVLEAQRQIFKIVKRPLIFCTVEKEDILDIYVYQSEEEESAVEEGYVDESEQAVIKWVLKHKEPAGKGTDTLPGAKAYYLPIISGNDETVAVVGVVLCENEQMEDHHKSLLAALLGQIAFALDKYFVNLRTKQAAMEAQSENLRANLLRAISHDLRTPLTSISGSASSLLSTDFSVNTRRKLIQGIYDDAIWLNNLVENLLSISRIDNRNVELKMEPQMVEEVITEAIDHVNQDALLHSISVQVKDPLLMAYMNATLIVQVLVNILNNAIEYTPPNSQIDILAFKETDHTMIRVTDNGYGIGDDDKKHIFDMFFTGKDKSSDSRRGLGIGLPLCKSIIAAHGGDICVSDNDPSGTVFEFTLPLAEVKTHEDFNLGS